MDKLIFATGNEGKMKEVRMILADLGFEIQSMKEAGINIDIVEDGQTFEENALIKARAISKETGCLVLADDSGLEVDYMDKAPGIYSARFLGEDTSYRIKNQHIIDGSHVLDSKFNKNYFTKKDIRIEKEVKLYSKSAKILTMHPSSSYTLQRDANKMYVLRINNPQLFWSTSKYLVIQVK